MQARKKVNFKEQKYDQEQQDLQNKVVDLIIKLNKKKCVLNTTLLITENALLKMLFDNLKQPLSADVHEGLTSLIKNWLETNILLKNKKYNASEFLNRGAIHKNVRAFVKQLETDYPEAKPSRRRP